MHLISLPLLLTIYIILDEFKDYVENLYFILLIFSGTFIYQRKKTN